MTIYNHNGYYGGGMGLTGSLHLEVLKANKKRNWRRLFTREIPLKRLTEPFWFRLLGEECCVPAGFVTNFASTPWVFWFFCPPDGIYTVPAVIHDWLYARGAYSRAQCDTFFCEFMRRAGVPPFQREVMHQALKLFGWAAWNKCRAKDPKRSESEGD